MSNHWELRQAKKNDQGLPCSLYRSQERPELFKRVQLQAGGHGGVASSMPGWFTEYSLRDAKRADGAQVWVRTLAEVPFLLEGIAAHERIMAYNANSDIYTPRPV